MHKFKIQHLNSLIIFFKDMPVILKLLQFTLCVFFIPTTGCIILEHNKDSINKIWCITVYDPKKNKLSTFTPKQKSNKVPRP